MVQTRSGASPQKSARPPVRAAKPAQKLGPWLLRLCYVGIPVALVVCVLGCAGMAVLIDEPERAAWYSQTRFAHLWRQATQQNPFYTTVCVNGGLVTALMLGAKLQEHRRALAAERQQAKARKAQ